MLEEKIQIKRKELDKSIENNQKYEDIYKLSVELDELISEFYKESKEKPNKKRKTILGKKISFCKVLYMA